MASLLKYTIFIIKNINNPNSVYISKQLFFNKIIT